MLIVGFAWPPGPRRGAGLVERPSSRPPDVDEIGRVQDRVADRDGPGVPEGLAGLLEEPLVLGARRRSTCSSAEEVTARHRDRHPPHGGAFGVPEDATAFPNRARLNIYGFRRRRRSSASPPVHAPCCPSPSRGSTSTSSPETGFVDERAPPRRAPPAGGAEEPVRPRQRLPEPQHRAHCLTAARCHHALMIGSGPPPLVGREEELAALRAAVAAAAAGEAPRSSSPATPASARPGWWGLARDGRPARCPGARRPVRRPGRPRACPTWW